MKTYSFWHIESGRFIDRIYSGDQVASNTPAGCRAVEGVHEAPPDQLAIERQERAQVIRRIRALEAQQMRPLRELAVDPDNPIARERLGAIDTQISKLRAALAQEPAS